MAEKRGPTRDLSPDTRPSKVPRLMAIDDAFNVRKPKTTKVPKLVLESAFPDTHASTSASRSNARTTRPSDRRPTGLLANVGHSETAMRSTVVSIGSSGLPTRSTIQPTKPVSSPALRRLKAPIFAAPQERSREDSAKNIASSGSPRFLLESDPDRSISEPVKKARRPPPPPPSTSSSSTSFKTLQAPQPQSLNPDAPPKEMKAISNTRVARAIDPMTEGGDTELLSISIQEHGHGFVTSEQKEYDRGLLVSPEKSERRKGKFVRNGLAERASLVLSRSQTSFLLWQKELESTVRQSRRMSPDLRLRVAKVLHIVLHYDRFRPSPTPKSALALCRETHTSHSNQDHIVLFSFAPPTSTNMRISTAEYFAQDAEVYIWQPWQEVTTAEDDSAGQGSLPRGESISKQILLCSRFYFVDPSDPS